MIWVEYHPGKPGQVQRYLFDRRKTKVGLFWGRQGRQLRRLYSFSCSTWCIQDMIFSDHLPNSWYKELELYVAEYLENISAMSKLYVGVLHNAFCQDGFLANQWNTYLGSKSCNPSRDKHHPDVESQCVWVCWWGWGFLRLWRNIWWWRKRWRSWQSSRLGQGLGFVSRFCSFYGWRLMRRSAQKCKQPCSWSEN